MTGVDIPIPELQLTIHQPRITEISYMGELDYFSIIQTICFDKMTIIAANPKGASRLSTMSNFQIFMTLINIPDQNAQKRIQNNLMTDYVDRNTKQQSFVLRYDVL